MTESSFFVGELLKFKLHIQLTFFCRISYIMFKMSQKMSQTKHYYHGEIWRDSHISLHEWEIGT